MVDDSNGSLKNTEKKNRRLSDESEINNLIFRGFVFSINNNENLADEM